jgi:hypothetical protein
VFGTHSICYNRDKIDEWTVNPVSTFTIPCVFAEMIQETELQTLLMTINLLAQYPGLAEATRLMMTSIGWQDEMMIAPCLMARVHWPCSGYNNK